MRKHLEGIGTSPLTKAWLRDIETLVDPVLANERSVGTIIKSVPGILSKLMPGYMFDIKILNVEKPFIMSIYPDIKQLEEKSSSLVKQLNDKNSYTFEFVETWNTITKWHIEIDEKLFKDGAFKLSSGREFVAILMHELGHVSTTNHTSLIMTYKKNKMKFQMVEKLLLSESFLLRKVFMPMLVHTLNFRVITFGHIKNDLEEIKADLHVPMEYKSDLVSYLDRCVLSNPKCMNDVVMTRSQLENDQEVAVLFTRETLMLMKHRRNILAKYIEAQYKMTESPYLQELTHRFGTLYSGIRLEGREGSIDIVKEGSIAREYNLEYQKYENLANKILNESQRVTDRDLSILQVESETMETPEDKMYVLHTLHDYIEYIEAELRKKNKSITQEEINKDSRVVYLKSLRTEIMKKTITEKQYGVFIKYPVGYEG